MVFYENIEQIPRLLLTTCLLYLVLFPPPKLEVYF